MKPFAWIALAGVGFALASLAARDALSPAELPLQPDLNASSTQSTVASEPTAAVSSPDRRDEAIPVEPRDLLADIPNLPPDDPNRAQVLSSLIDRGDALMARVAEIRASAGLPAQPVPTSSTTTELRSEVDALRARAAALN